jgi:hypothetical protein
MNTKKLFAGGITGGIVYFILGYLVYGKLLMDYFTQHHGMTTGFMRNPLAMPLIIYLLVGNLLGGLLLTYIFLKANVASFGSGLVTGGIIGFLVVGSGDCINYATTTLMSEHGMLADIVAGTIMSAITGAIIGMVLSKKD